MTMHEAAPIDEIRATAFEEEFLKMISRSGAMQDFKFNEHRLFDYKGEKDGLVFFAQHMANGFQMMQMIILVSGESKQYLLTYTDLASRFSEQQAYDAAWKSMTSIEVPGIAPKRYMREMKIGGAIAGGLLVIILPFAFARLSSQRRIRKMVNALENDWDKGSDEASTLESNISHLGVTKVTSLQTTGTEGGGWSLGTPSGMSDIKSISMVKGKMKQQYSSLG